MNIIKIMYQILFISLWLSWSSNEIYVHFFSQLFLQMAWEGNVDMSDVLYVEVQWSPVLWQGLLALWMEIHHKNRKAQQIPEVDVLFFSSSWWCGTADSAVTLYISLLSAGFVHEVCMQVLFSLPFIILRLKLTSVISMLSRNYWKLLVCVIHQEGEASTPGKSGRQIHLTHHGGPSKFSVRLAFLHYVTLPVSLGGWLFSKIWSFVSLYICLDVAVVWYSITLALLQWM